MRQFLRCDDLPDSFGRLAAQDPVRSLLDALLPDADAHLVGGAVRDVLLGEDPHDIDLATVLPPEETARRLGARGIRVVETGIKHGTVTAVMEPGNVEITTFREPAPHGVNNYSTSIEVDLSGRDFTINALAWSYKRAALVDPFNGAKDLEQKILRAVGTPAERFSEDPLRLLRAIRFGPAQGRAIDPETERAITETRPLLQKVSVERIRDEFVRILICPEIRAALHAMWNYGVFQDLFPELVPMKGLAQNEFHTEDVFDHTISVLERTAPDPTLRLIALFHDIGKPATLSVGEDGRRHFYEHEYVSEKMTKEIMERLRFSHSEIHHVSSVVRLHMRPTECGLPGVRRILRDTGPYYPSWRVFKWADKPPIMPDSEVEERLDRFDQMVETERLRVSDEGKVKLAVRGDDLLGIGYQPGKFLGSVLKQLEELVIEDPSQNTRETLLSRARDLLTANK